MKRRTTSEFINLAKSIHGDKYDYSKVEYVNNTTCVCIICPKHGEFWQPPKNHLNGYGCQKCAREYTGIQNKTTNEQFVIKAKKIHGDKYDYSKTEYVNYITPICIICPKHGEFWQAPTRHLNGLGCPQCVSEHRHNCRRWTTEKFIIESKKRYGEKFDYSKVQYVNTATPIIIGCPIHGNFEITPHDHLHVHGCPMCAEAETIANRNNKKQATIERNEKRKQELRELRIKEGRRAYFKITTQDFIIKAQKVHANKYDYSKVDLADGGGNKKVCIICPKHGEFWQTPHNHLANHGCPKCAWERIQQLNAQTIEEFIAKAVAVHGNKYDYSNVNYINNRTYVNIVCPKHGAFNQTPAMHLAGQGCPICKQSRMENEIGQILKENSIEYIQQKTFDWLKRQRSLHLDFFLPQYNIAIECQGIQHFENEHFGGHSDNDVLTDIQALDGLKKQLCEEHGIKMLYYANYEYNFPYEVETSKEKLIATIINSKER